jgi:hypothetical protein
MKGRWVEWLVIAVLLQNEGLSAPHISTLFCSQELAWEPQVPPLAGMGAPGLCYWLMVGRPRHHFSVKQAGD